MGKGSEQALRLRRVGIDTYRENVAYLHRDCPVYRTDGFQALARVEIAAAGQAHGQAQAHAHGRALDQAHDQAHDQAQAHGQARTPHHGHLARVQAILNVVDDAGITAPDELGLSEQAFSQLGLPAGARVTLAHAEPPESLSAVRRKIAGARLEEADYLAIAQDMVAHRFSKMEIAAFLVASSQGGLDRDEILYLTRAMVATGERLEWGEEIVVDKHCIGGIPGNRTSMLVVPIVAAHGMLIPKTSSRAITSPAGTADTMELLADVELSPDRLREIVRHHRGCLAWGGTAHLAPMDDILIAVERPLSMDSPGQMVASILSKKVAAGSTHLLIDIPVGPTAKVREVREALQLRKLFEFVGDRLGLHTEVVVSDGRQPIGRGIGPVLELRDVMQCLENAPNAPQDLRQKALRLAGRVIEFDPDVRGGRGYAIARDILDSGRALTKMREIARAQGARPHPPPLGELHHPIRAARGGVVTGIDNLHLAHIARLAGAPLDKGAGVDLHRKLGEPVKRGEALYTIHAAHPSEFRFACEYASRHGGLEIGPGVPASNGGFVDEQPL